MKKQIIGLILTMATTATMARGTLQRSTPTTSEFAREVLTNETALLWRNKLGIPQGVTNVTQLSVSATNVPAAAIPVARTFASTNYGRLDAPVPNVWSLKDRAPVPWLGWNSYFTKTFTLTEADVTNTATAFAANGMLDAGYNFIWLDSGWTAQTNNADGSIVVDATRFPHGIGWLSDWLHTHGFQFGLYVNADFRNCDTSSTNGSYGHELAHAKQLDGWGVDAMKVDRCNPLDDTLTDSQAMLLWYNALSPPNVHRPIIIQMTQAYTYLYTPSYLNAWQNAQGEAILSDDGDSMNLLCKALTNIVRGQITDTGATVTSMTGDIAMVSPGHYRDELCFAANLGNKSLTNIISVCAEFVQPMLVQYVPTDTSCFTNTEVLAVLRDPACAQGAFVTNISNVSIFSRPLGYDGAQQAVLLFNTNSSPVTLSLDFSIFGFSVPVTVRDVWSQTNIGTATSSFLAAVNPTCGALTVTVPNRGVRLFRVWKQPSAVTPTATGVDPNQPLVLQNGYFDTRGSSAGLLFHPRNGDSAFWGLYSPAADVVSLYSSAALEDVITIANAGGHLSLSPGGNSGLIEFTIGNGGVPTTFQGAHAGLWSGNLLANGYVQSTGTVAGLSFKPRNGANGSFIWYSEGQYDFKLYDTTTSGPVLTATNNSGNYTLDGGVAQSWSLGQYSKFNYVGSFYFATNTPPVVPTSYGQVFLWNSNGYPYLLLSTNGAGGSLSWTGTNKLGW